MALFDTKLEALDAAKVLERDHAADLRTLRNVPFAEKRKPQHTGLRAGAAKRLREALRAIGGDL